MTNKETRARDVCSININSTRFVDNLVFCAEVHKFCINVSKNSRVTGQIVKRLMLCATDE